MSYLISRRNVTKAALAASTGAALVGYESATAQDIADSTKPMQNYAELRVYSGRASGVRITAEGIAGFFRRDDADTSSADNGGTIIVDASGRRWKRLADTVNGEHFGVSDSASPSVNRSSIQSAIDAAEANPATVNRWHIRFKPGSFEYQIDGQINVDKKNIRIEGNNVVIKWSGNSADPMFHVTDSSRCRWENMILRGDYNNKPFAAFYFEGLSTSTTGTNENHVIDGVIIGRRFGADTTTGGSMDTPPGDPNTRRNWMQNGIVVGGPQDGNNDEYVIRSVQVHACDSVGIDFRNTQSIWSSITDTLVNQADIGIKVGANITLRNVTFNRNATADVMGIRDLECVINMMSAENSNIFVNSKAGASFFIHGGKFLRNSNTGQAVFKWESGGTMVLEDLTVINQGAGTDTIYYRGGSLKGGAIRVRNCTIKNGGGRDTWDIDTSTSKQVTIDIEHGKFRWRTTRPYIDRAVTPAATATAASQVIGSGTAYTPMGDFHHVSYQMDLQGQHLTPAPDSAGQIRAQLFNATAGAITLNPGRMRWMNVGDYVAATASASVDAPLMTNNTAYSATIALPGAQMGDFIVWGAMGAYYNEVVTAYVSAANTVTLRIHNASGGSLDPAATTLTVGKLREFGNFANTLPYTPAAFANAATVSMSVSVPGAQLGGHAFVAYSADLKGLICTAYVSAADTVTIVLTNYTGAPVTLDPGYFKAMVAF